MGVLIVEPLLLSGLGLLLYFCLYSLYESMADFISLSLANSSLFVYSLFGEESPEVRFKAEFSLSSGSC